MDWRVTKKMGKMTQKVPNNLNLPWSELVENGLPV